MKSTLFTGWNERRERMLRLPLAVRWARFLVAWSVALFLADAGLALLGRLL